ncbi:MAG TPA: hypothetical protein VM425_07050 [Myxococcota bacterium]|nr:hypothetical protein [Myxococcota bacterium]
MRWLRWIDTSLRYGYGKMVMAGDSSLDVEYLQGIHLVDSILWLDAPRLADLCFVSHAQQKFAGPHRKILLSEKTAALLLNPELTRKQHVSSDGTILLVRGESKQKITIGADLERAKRNLRKLDSEFQKAMLKLHRNKDVVYLIRGHGERGPSGFGYRARVTSL